MPLMAQTSTDALAQAIDAYRRATPGSAALHARASTRLPGGVTSNVKYFAPHPVFVDRAAGAHLWDVDGREYVDYCLGFGPLIAGHGHPRVMDAIAAELARRRPDASGVVLEATFTSVQEMIEQSAWSFLPVSLILTQRFDTISKIGEILDLGVKAGLVEKSGAWYAYKGDKIGQGKQNAIQYLRDNPTVAQTLEARIKEELLGPSGKNLASKYVEEDIAAD